MADDFTLFSLRNSKFGQHKPYRSEIVVRRLRLRLLLPIKEASFDFTIEVKLAISDR